MFFNIRLLYIITWKHVFLFLGSEGKRGFDLVIVTCLFASGGHDIRALIHNGAGEEDLQAAIAAIWHRREDRYSEIRSEDTAALPRIEMSYIGG